TPAASRRLSGYSGEVRSQRVLGPPSVRPENSTLKEAMFGSVLPAADITGVSTSSTPRSAKNPRTAAYNRARNRSAPTPAVGCQSLAMLVQEIDEPGFVPDVEAEVAGLGELAAGGFAGDHEAGLLRDAAGDLGAEGLQALAGLLAGHGREAAGQHHGLPGQRTFAGAARRAFLPVHPGGAQRGDHLAVVRLGEEVRDALRHHRADVRHLLQRLFVGLHDRVERAEVARQRLGGALADIADTERVQHPLQARGLARL